MTNEVFVGVLLFIGFIFAGFIWLLNARDKKMLPSLADSIPLDVLELVLSVVAGVARPAALKTETKLDDELVDKAELILEMLRAAKQKEAESPEEGTPPAEHTEG